MGEIPGPMGKQVGGGRGISLCMRVVGEDTRTHVFGGGGGGVGNRRLQGPVVGVGENSRVHV